MVMVLVVNFYLNGMVVSIASWWGTIFFRSIKSGIWDVRLTLSRSPSPSTPLNI